MPEMMKAVIKAEAGPGLTLTERPIPTIGPHDVLVKVKAASICGTDLHIYHWDPWAADRIHPPVITGHEVCGEIVETGSDVSHVKVGDFVSLESHVVCGHCRFCLTGNGHLCENTQLIGVDRDGGFAEYIAIPAQNAWPNPPDLPLEIAVLMENFGNAVHTAFAADVRAKKVLVTGCGPVGLMTIAVVKAIGARAVFATDISDYRLDFARRMGADHTFNAREGSIVEPIMDITHGEGVDVWLEMSGAESAINEGFKALKPGGEVAVLGVAGRPIHLDWDHHIVFKGVKLHGITGRRLWETWYQARGLVFSGAVDLSQMVTHRYRLEDFEQAFATMESGQSGKVMLLP